MRRKDKKKTKIIIFSNNNIGLFAENIFNKGSRLNPHSRIPLFFMS